MYIVLCSSKRARLSKERGIALSHIVSQCSRMIRTGLDCVGLDQIAVDQVVFLISSSFHDSCGVLIS